jgi:hypothetical protein
MGLVNAAGIAIGAYFGGHDLAELRNVRIEEEVEEHNLKEDDLVLGLEIDLDGDEKADIRGSEQKARIEADEDENVRGLFEGLFLE